MVSFQWVIYQTAKVMSTVAAVVLLGIMTLTCADVVGRYFGYPIAGTYDMVGIGGGAVLALGIAMSHVAGLKIRMDSIYKRPEILRLVVDTVVWLLSFGTLGLIAWRCFILGFDLFKRNRVSDTIQIPLYPFLFLAGVGMSIYAIVILLEHMVDRSSRM